MSKFILPGVELENDRYCTGCDLAVYMQGNGYGHHVCVRLNQDLSTCNFKRPSDCPLQLIKPAPSCESCKLNKTYSDNCDYCYIGAEEYSNNYEPREKEQGE